MSLASRNFRKPTEVRGLGAVPWRILSAFVVLLLLVEVPQAQTEPGIPRSFPGLEALAQVPMPAAVGRLLKRVGIEPRGDTLLSSVHPGFRTPPPVDPQSVALMQQARIEDVSVDRAAPLFDEKFIELGLWHSSLFLDTYGTALFLAGPYDDERIPVVLVHGITGSPRDFRSMVSRFADSPYQPVLFFYPSGMPLGEAAHQLGMRLQEFVLRHDVERFAVVGHSMGGLVAKGMLDQFDVAQVLPGWQLLVSLSTPWGGVGVAEHSGQIPRHPPSWDDMPPTSAFLRQINATPFPSEVPFYVFFGARGDPSIFRLGNSDGVVALEGSVDAPVTKSAREVVGFYEDHNSILTAPRVQQHLEAVLAAELPPGSSFEPKVTAGRRGRATGRAAARH